MDAVKVDANEKAYFDSVADGEGEPRRETEIIDGHEITWHIFRDGRREQVLESGRRMFVRGDGIAIYV